MRLASRRPRGSSASVASRQNVDRAVVHNEGMRVRSLGYRTDLAVRRAEGSTVTDRGDHIVVRTDQNPRYWWGNFLLLARAPRGSEMAGWLDRFAGTFPAARHRAFGVDVTRATEVDEAVFTAAGLAADRGIVLTASGVREPRRPHPGAVIRPLAGADDWRQACVLRAACGAADERAALPEDHEFIELRTMARRRLAEARRATWFGAFTGGRLVAQLGLVPLPGRLARFQDVETHPSFRRQGLAGTLVWHAAGYGLDELRATTLVIVADRGSAATRVYASVGFEPAEDTIGFVWNPRAPLSGQGRRASACSAGCGG
jgi:GNAT superfamily N-acetyltransferase